MKRRQFSRLGMCGMALTVALAVALAGCSNGIERAQVSGRVTVDGQPIQRGQIRFVPRGENQGPSWSAWIKDGHYTTEGSKGTPVGDLAVEVRAFRAVRGAAVAADEPEDMDAPYEQYLPAKFNLQTVLETKIESGSRQVERNFDLSLR